MSPAARKRKYQRDLAALRKRAAAGDVSAMDDLGLWLLDGLQDRQGRSVVRRNPAAALRLFQSAVDESGGKEGAFSLGYAYDNGLGTKPSRLLALYWYRRAARNGSSTAAFNIATVYRDFYDFRTMFRWWVRAAKMDDGDAAENTGYCYQYGIGVRRNVLKARHEFRPCHKVRMHFRVRPRRSDVPPCRFFPRRGQISVRPPTPDSRAAKDHDYPEAMSLLSQIRSRIPIIPCRCRRATNRLGHEMPRSRGSGSRV